MIEPPFLSATRAGYDAVAAEYVEYARTDLDRKPLDRAMLAAFADTVTASARGPVVEIGCGYGRVAAHLHSLGVPISGIDLSPKMVELARRTYPDLRFDEGSMTALDLPDGSLGGVVAWYSVIHVPPALLPDVFAEFHRVLASGGDLLLAFQVGDEPLHLTEAFGHAVSLDFHRLSPDRVADLLSGAGFAVTARLLREADETERTPQAVVVARKPAGVG
ncbi:class I SAM-dependent DNA methyltransferase [Umezawaea beigongshangensis]|uniref:class I SAM-dependent DNA methyltransferase n=1 Tax=Umezawaea beigongshangensis TaxID=2780383 RepID=UPI0018F184E4|nr:class I SAM-dependent methyltransferase [Umezawaea beigongshangensis]